MSTFSGNPAFKRRYQVIMAFIAWFTVIFDFSLSGRHLIQFLSYFTIESNLLIALGMTIAVAVPNTRTGKWVTGNSFQTALAVYIVVVAVVYNFVLRNSWAITGWGSITDDMLHVVIPLLYLVYWFIFIPSRSLRWAYAAVWLIFPAIYMIYTFLRGEVIGKYPYPFLNVTKIGFEQALINSGFVALGFLVTGFILVFLNKTRIARIIKD